MEQMCPCWCPMVDMFNHAPNADNIPDIDSGLDESRKRLVRSAVEQSANVRCPSNDSFMIHVDTIHVNKQKQWQVWQGEGLHSFEEYIKSSTLSGQHDLSEFPWLWLLASHFESTLPQQGLQHAVQFPCNLQADRLASPRWGLHLSSKVRLCRCGKLIRATPLHCLQVASQGDGRLWMGGAGCGNRTSRS